MTTLSVLSRRVRGAFAALSRRFRGGAEPRISRLKAFNLVLIANIKK